MKKNIITTLIICIIFSVSLIKVTAASASLGINGVTAVSPGQTVTYNLSFSNLSAVAPNGLNALGPIEISYNADIFTFVEIKKTSAISSAFSFSTSIDTPGVITLTTYATDGSSVIKSNTTSIATITFKVKSTAQKVTTSIAVKDVQGASAFVGGDSIDYNISPSALSINVGDKLPDNADLSSISIDGFVMEPEFSPSKTTGYKINVGSMVDSVNIIAQSADPLAKVSIRGNTGLSAGENRMTITVTAQDGFTQKTYTVTAVKENEITSEPAHIAEITTAPEQLSSSSEENTGETAQRKGFLQSPLQISVAVNIILALIILALVIFIFSSRSKKGQHSR